MQLVVPIELKQICNNHGIALMYTFGSQKDRVRDLLNGSTCEVQRDALADADIGVVFQFPLHDGVTQHTLYAALYNDLEDLVLPLPLDLIFLQECHSVMQFEVIKGLCMYQISEDFRDAFEINVLCRVPDFRRLLNQYHQERLDRYT